MVTADAEKRVTVVLPFSVYVELVGNKQASMNAQIVRAVQEMLARERKQ